MCDDCRKTLVDCHSGAVEVEVSGWGTWNIWVDVEPDEGFRSSLLGPRDALRLARVLVVADVQLWVRQRRERRDRTSSVPSGAVKP